jgi:4-hydroxy-2-oxoheptanedioate aldolase
VSGVHGARRRLRAALAEGRRITGVFVKLPTTDVVGLAAAAGFDAVIIDLEHSALAESDAMTLVRFADALGMPAVVRIPAVDTALVNRLLESGATGLQLSMLAGVDQRMALQSAVTYGPGGRRSVSLAHPSAGYGAAGLGAYLTAERADPPLLVGQIEGPTVDPLVEVVAGLDVAFVGTTDLTVALGLRPDDRVAVAGKVAAVEAAAAEAGVAFGGWAPRPEDAGELGLAAAGYLVVGSDLQFLGAALRAAAPVREEDP